MAGPAALTWHLADSGTAAQTRRLRDAVAAVDGWLHAWPSFLRVTVTRAVEIHVRTAPEPATAWEADRAIVTLPEAMLAGDTAALRMALLEASLAVVETAAQRGRAADRPRSAPTEARDGDDIESLAAELEALQPTEVLVFGRVDGPDQFDDLDAYVMDRVESDDEAVADTAGGPATATWLVELI
ncbi:hypothetical protein [Asanoa siamensis]|uniref:Uncharacterized protein n=1 Tax=Asanoa siamensis TaxID=926357 RepID=A0ABQ4CZ17_9ACTN|nr:hypothetical protein [Asanoa siamensis]GIF76527.1 hypothetical protein Asi02nite_60450 [Asanoa siamensis]